MKEENNRLQWMDIAKGLAIILMVVGHTSIPKCVSDFIWSFHMPLFFIASGWCTDFGKNDFGLFAKNKLKKLGMPFIVYSVIVVCLMMIINFRDPIEVILNGWDGYALWFIPVLMGALLLSKLIMSIEIKFVRILLWLSTALIGASLSYYRVSLPWTLSTIPYACFLMLIGNKAKQYQDYISSPKWWVLIGNLLVTIVVSHFYRLDMAWNNITPVTILTIGACSGTLMMFTLSSYVEKYTKYASLTLQTIGRETYLILAFSQITIIMLNHYLELNFVAKYAILIFVLVLLKYIKDGIYALMTPKML